MDLFEFEVVFIGSCLMAFTVSTAYFVTRDHLHLLRESVERALGF